MSATTTSPATPRCRPMLSSAAATHCSMLSASFRQGMTTETTGESASWASGARPPGARLRNGAHLLTARIIISLPTSHPFFFFFSPPPPPPLFFFLRICIIYDCLYPHTVGARSAGTAASRSGSRRGARSHICDAAPVGPRGPGVPGRARRCRHPADGALPKDGRRRYCRRCSSARACSGTCGPRPALEAVHTASFPYFSLLAAARVRPLARYQLVVDWFEVWSPATGATTSAGWGAGGRAGAAAVCGCPPARVLLLAAGWGGWGRKVCAGVTVLGVEFEGTLARPCRGPPAARRLRGTPDPGETAPPGEAVVHAVAKARETSPRAPRPDLRRRPRASRGAGRDRPKLGPAKVSFEAPGFVARGGGHPRRARARPLRRPALAARRLRPDRAGGRCARHPRIVVAGDDTRPPSSSRRARTASSRTALTPRSSLP